MDEEGKLKRWRETTEALLGSVVSQQYCQPYSICLVPEELRKWKEDAFKPKMVSMGPRYRGRRELLQLEEVKWRYMMSLLNRTQIEAREVLETCMRVMLEHDAAVRASYGEEIKLDRFDLATIMIYDGCFLLELLIYASQEWNSRLPSVKSFHGPGAALSLEVLSDLILVENQIPLFILYKLFQILFPQLDANAFGIATYIRITQDLALSFLHYSPDSSSTSTPSLVNATHFLQLAHSTIVRKSNYNQQSLQYLSDFIVDGVIVHIGITQQKEVNRCATRLRAAGVTIKRQKNSQLFPSRERYEFDIKFNKSNGVLEIPQLRIDEITEANWRNFIAWEQSLKDARVPVDSNGQIFTFFAFFFNDLICCPSDVHMLRNRGIITASYNFTSHDLVDLFRSITSDVYRGYVDPSYCDIIHALNAYSATNCVVRFPIFLYHYLSRISEWISGFHKFLRRGYNFAAALVTLLTLIQTFYAVLSYHFPAKEKNN